MVGWQAWLMHCRTMEHSNNTRVLRHMIACLSWIFDLDKPIHISIFRVLLFTLASHGNLQELVRCLATFIPTQRKIHILINIGFVLHKGIRTFIQRSIFLRPRLRSIKAPLSNSFPYYLDKLSLGIRKVVSFYNGFNSSLKILKNP